MCCRKRRLRSPRQKRLAKFGPKFVGAFMLLEVVKDKSITDVEGESTTVNLAPIRVYKFIHDNESSRI